MEGKNSEIMTFQEPDKITINGIVYDTWSFPLQHYWKKKRKNPFRWANTGCWRAYVAHWEIVDDTLFLIGVEESSPIILERWPDEEEEPEVKFKPKTVHDIFPEFHERLCAYWFSGNISIPIGTELRRHLFVERTHEMQIEIEKGMVKSKIVVPYEDKMHFHNFTKKLDN